MKQPYNQHKSYVETGEIYFVTATIHSWHHLLLKPEFKKMLLSGDREMLELYRVHATNKKYEFWQRDSSAIQLYTPAVAFQKLNYIHMNPLAEHWQLATDPCDYIYSSASFYEKDDRQFLFLKDLRNEF